jgi:hypothetical protein
MRRLVHSYACTGWVFERQIMSNSLTLDVIKFGITYSVNSRNGQYARDRDNGYICSVSTVQAAKKHRLSRTSWGTTFLRSPFSTATNTSTYRCLRDTGRRVRQYVIWFVRRSRHCTNTCCVWCTRCGLVTRICTATRMTSSPITLLLSTTSNDTTSIHSDLSFNALWLMRNARLHWTYRSTCSHTPPLVEEVTVPDPMTKIWGIEHRGDLTVDDVVDSAPKLANDPLKMHEKFDKFVDEMCIVDPEGLNSTSQLSYVVSRIRTWFVSEHEQLHGQAIR